MNLRMLSPLVVAVALMALCAVFQGRLTDRWSQARTQLLNRWVAHLADVPTTIGDWDATELEASSEDVKRIAKFAGERPLLFKNRRSGEVVYMILMVGASRNVAMHTPDKCMPAQGFNLGEKMSTFTLDYGNKLQGTFYTSMFTKETAESTQRQRILWAWNDGEGWQAPGYPKLAFAGSPALYKLYLITPIDKLADRVAESPAVQFAADLLPVLDRVLLAEAPTGSPAPQAEPGVPNVAPQTASPSG